jgi:hypothetical protein
MSPTLVTSAARLPGSARPVVSMMMRSGFVV